MKKPPDHRNNQDLFELLSIIKNIDFFAEKGIVGRDLLDVCECLTYEHKEFGEKIIEPGDSPDTMYILLDGQANIYIDMRKVNIRDGEVDELCADMMLNKKELVKKIVEFRDKTGITKENQRVMRDIKQRMTTAMRQMITNAQS